MPLASTILPKRARYIEGLGADSIVDLKATLFNATEAQRTNRPANFNTDRPLRAAKKPFRVNRGVSERHASDVAEARDGAQSDINITASLTKKAAQYAELNGASMDDHNNHCLVDFEYKQLYGMPGQDAHVGPEPASEQQALAAALRSGAAREPTTDESLISSMISAAGKSCKEGVEQEAHADKLARLQNRAARARRKQDKVRAQRKQQINASAPAARERVEPSVPIHRPDVADISQLIEREAQEQRRVAENKNHEWGKLRAQGTTFVAGTTEYSRDMSSFVRGPSTPPALAARGPATPP